jgi:3'-phosphoadenosine 5'-phosphosulfate sulfotransferase (PAPS reductase)/FAD synthetase
MRNPFEITEPTCISFSGGRTSAFMLYKVLEAHNMSLPDEAVVCFANTGKEDEATLKFVHDCETHWNVPIVWLEYRDAEESKDRWTKVTYETASRNGEPFEAVIRKKNYLPNPVTRFCTIEMKIRTIANYLFSKGMCDTRSEGEYMSWVGIRADEPRRAAKIPRDRTPLVTAGVTKEIVGEFWRNQPFDLELPNINGVTYHGNCDLCFLKGSSQTMSLIAEKPERAVWWAKMEALALASKPDGARFRKDRPGYQEMMNYATNQTDFFGMEDETIPCFCGD